MEQSKIKTALLITIPVSAFVLPKLNLAGISVSIADMTALLTIIFFSRQRAKLHHADKLWLLSQTFIFFSTFTAFFLWGQFSTTRALTSVKYMLPFLVYLLVMKSMETKDLKAVISVASKLIVISALILSIPILTNIITGQTLNTNRLIFEYDSAFRLYSPSGEVFGQDTIKGTTSVQTGVLLALVACYFLSAYATSRRKRDLVYFSAATFLMLLTFSRSGLLVFVVAVLIFIFSGGEKNLRVRGFIVVFLAMVSTVAVTLNLGTLLKIADLGISDYSAVKRLELNMLAAQFLIENPILIVFGVGANPDVNVDILGWSHLENLLITCFFESGIFPFLALILFFFKIWKLSNKKNKKSESTEKLTIFIFFPGFFLANLVGGNSLNTDFIAPLVFLLIACLFQNSVSNKLKARR